MRCRHIYTPEVGRGPRCAKNDGLICNNGRGIEHCRPKDAEGGCDDFESHPRRVERGDRTDAGVAL